MLLYGSGISDGNLHMHDNLPMVLVGGAAGRIKGGRHLVYPKGTPVTNLFLNMLDKLGVPAENLGDSTGGSSTRPICDRNRGPAVFALNVLSPRKIRSGH